jgi:triphosphoribosyl-dephospho-CoA synthetase
MRWLARVPLTLKPCVFAGLLEVERAVQCVFMAPQDERDDGLLKKRHDTKGLRAVRADKSEGIRWHGSRLGDRHSSATSVLRLRQHRGVIE